ncbi:DUF1796 family putative cysteine peptidase [Paenibacillus sp. YPG26]|uniref:DUF1796 family putative cysteine peptidase n=1 Tax=Paenibacillus sp. YPG26 TaxID=2878915 RepID=UPI0020411504|nr:DUF1796 family putative cysteine peptidase [Paenibacillus sp. YPG26]USB31886.1 papain-like cysteine peptidase [Paenibacillus sp. YPG26]
MIHSPLSGTYDALFSLGANCQTAYQLRRLGARHAAGPLDWFISSSHRGLIAVLQNRFEDFMKLDHLKLVGQFKTCYCIKDEKYDIFSYHDFPVTLPPDRWTEAYQEFQSRQLRRQERFLQTASRAERILYIRMGSTLDEAIHLQQILSELTAHSFTLLIVNTGHKTTQKICPEFKQGIIMAELNKGSDWRGDDQGWEQLLQDIVIKD